MKRKIILSTFSIAMLFIANSCSTNSPEKRIAKNPALFDSLSISDQEQAQQGKIKRGMHKDAVSIAWGKPTGVSQGNRSGKTYEKWVYTRSVPLYRHGFSPYGSYGYGSYGYGPYGHGRYRHSRYGYGFGYSPQVYYTQRTSATVEFDRYGKVTEWVTRK